MKQAGLGVEKIKECGAIAIEYGNDASSFLDHFWDKIDYVIAERMVGLKLSHDYFKNTFQVVSEPIEQRDVVCLAHQSRHKLIDNINRGIETKESTTLFNEIIKTYSSGGKI